MESILFWLGLTARQFINYGVEVPEVNELIGQELVLDGVNCVVVENSHLTITVRRKWFAS